jgi:hypothetical protein
VFLKGNYLVSIICLPLTNNTNYNLCHVLPLQIKVEKTEFKFIFLLSEHEYLLMDVAKQYFARLRADKLNSIKIVSNKHRICKQTQPV